MAPTPASKSTPSVKSNASHVHSKTPQSKQRLNFAKEANAMPPDHPVEVVGRIRDHPEKNLKSNANPPSALQVNSDGKSLRVRMEAGYRDFSFDGVSLSEEDDLDGFYKKFVESRINGVKLGNKCTIMMYGPTGSGKSHTMFGSMKQPGIVYRSLRDILSEEVEENGEKLGVSTYVQVTVLEIYNEEIYDLLSSGCTAGGFSLGWSKPGSAPKVRLEVMGKKAKNATFISGNEAGKLLKEIQKVEKRRIVKSTNCNERSSRSHCMIILDVPTVGGQLMLVDMAGSENIEQAGQTGLDAKLQTAKINQGNIALKRVVESIANGDSHVPFRDSKLTMLLQDSFEDSDSKILMILCASPDTKELHKTIATLEYGAKAKCIVRGPHTPSKEKGLVDSSSAAAILGSRITALNEFISKIQTEHRIRENEFNKAQKELKRKEEEVSLLRVKLAGVRMPASEEEINDKVNERTETLKTELERRIQECQNMADESVEMERRKMEQRMFQQQQEVEMLKRRLEEIESELGLSRTGSIVVASADTEGGSSFMKKLMEACSEEDSDMVKSMDLSKSIDMETIVLHKTDPYNFSDGTQNFAKKATCLTTVYEEEEDESDENGKEEDLLLSDEEVDKEVIEEKMMIVTPEVSIQNPRKIFTDEHEKNSEDSVASTRETRIQNIFALCGNYRELSQNTSGGCKGSSANADDEKSTKNVPKDSYIEQKMADDAMVKDSKENQNPTNRYTGAGAEIEVYVKWEALKENPGKFITTVKVSKDSSLADLRKLIEIHLGGEPEQQAFIFLVLGDPSGAPVPREKEATTSTSKLPVCNNRSLGHLACLRPLNPVHRLNQLPFSPLENRLLTPIPNHRSAKKGFSPELDKNLGSTPITTTDQQPQFNSYMHTIV